MLVLALIVVGVAWLPLAARFWLSWRDRHNPVSLAICGAMAFMVWLHGALAWAIYTSSVSVEWFGATAVVLSTLLMAYFYVSFAWSRHRFPDSRSKLPKRFK